jgi:hypothetical protein
MKRGKRLLEGLAILTLAVSFAGPAWADAHARYFVRVSGVDEAPGVSSGFVDEAKRLFTEELARHAEFTLEWPAGLPDEPEALKQALKQRHLKAFEVTLKILGVTRDLKPPAPGKQYRRLVRGIKLAVFGDTLPEKVMAIGGDGDAQLSAEIGKQANVEAEGKQLLGEATKTAITQAVDMTLTKLKLNDQPVKLKLKKK